MPCPKRCPARGGAHYSNPFSASTTWILLDQHLGQRTHLMTVVIPSPPLQVSRSPGAGPGGFALTGGTQPPTPPPNSRSSLRRRVDNLATTGDAISPLCPPNSRGLCPPRSSPPRRPAPRGFRGSTDNWRPPLSISTRQLATHRQLTICSPHLPDNWRLIDNWRPHPRCPPPPRGMCP